MCRRPEISDKVDDRDVGRELAVELRVGRLGIIHVFNSNARPFKRFVIEVICRTVRRDISCTADSFNYGKQPPPGRALGL